MSNRSTEPLRAIVEREGQEEVGISWTCSRLSLEGDLGHTLWWLLGVRVAFPTLGAPATGCRPQTVFPKASMLVKGQERNALVLQAALLAVPWKATFCRGDRRYWCHLLCLSSVRLIVSVLCYPFADLRATPFVTCFRLSYHDLTCWGRGPCPRAGQGVAGRPQFLRGWGMGMAGAESRNEVRPEPGRALDGASEEAGSLKAFAEMQWKHWRLVSSDLLWGLQVKVGWLQASGRASNLELEDLASSPISWVSVSLTGKPK
jgi:hypothetical protein